MFFIAYAFKGHVHAFAGRVKVVSHSSCRTSAIFKFFCLLIMLSIFMVSIISFALTLYLIETPFKAYASKADPDQAALVRAA